MSEVLYASAAALDITPSHPAPLFGYEGRPAAFERIVDPLELNAILVRQGECVLLLVGADLLCVSDDLEAQALASIRGPKDESLRAVLLRNPHSTGV